MKLTEIDLYYNVPVDLQNTIHFKSNAERDAFFDRDYIYQKRTYQDKKRFNFVRDRLTLNIDLPTSEVNGLNYLRFRNEFDLNHWFYCFVERTEYINDHVTRLYLVADVIMTYTQGEFTGKVGDVFINRQSATEKEFEDDKLYLGTNDDVLNLPMQYVHKDLEYWEDLAIVFTTSVDLARDFGSENDPKLKTSRGQEHDGVVSPTDIYIAKDVESFQDFMKGISDYPWIAQNINDVALVPLSMVDENDLTDITSEHDFVTSNLMRFKNSSYTKSVDLVKLECATKDVLKDKFNLFEFPDFVFRLGYTNLELTNWEGQTIELDPMRLPDFKLRVVGQSTFGYHNEIDVFPDRYNDGGENSVTGLYRGSYKNNAIIFKDFDSIPVLIDNYKLGKAQTAHQRELANSNTFTGRVNRVLDNNNSLQDRFMSAVSLTSNVTSVSGIAGGLSNDYEYYRRQKASFEDMRINAPSLSEQSRSNAFAIGHFHYGVTAHYSAICPDDAVKVVRYHGTFGFDYQGTFKQLNPIGNKRVVAYYSFSGSYTLPSVPSQFMAQLKVQFENGMRFWIFDGSTNPMNDNDPIFEYIDTPDDQEEDEGV